MTMSKKGPSPFVAAAANEDAATIRAMNKMVLAAQIDSEATPLQRQLANSDLELSTWKLVPGKLGSCFYQMCALMGVDIPVETRRSSDLSSAVVDRLVKFESAKVKLIAYGLDDIRNHVELVSRVAPNYRAPIMPVGSVAIEFRVESVTSAQHFFQENSEWWHYSFYAEAVPAAAEDDSFGAAYDTPVRQPPVRQQVPQPPLSIAGDEVAPGGSNVSGGVVRSKRRVIQPKSVAKLERFNARNYRVTGAVMFNNFDEIFQDTMSRDYAQEVMEELFAIWDLPFDQPDTMKYAEDLIISFMIATTASNKADYNATFVIPTAADVTTGLPAKEIEVNMQTFSNLLTSGHNRTRRQFARAISDDQRDFLRREENNHLRPLLANRIGCEPGLAHLGFDGSTHCTGMTTREETFTKTLESRNLFERDDVVAQGASERLMQGFSGGTRSVVAR